MSSLYAEYWEKQANFSKFQRSRLVKQHERELEWEQNRDTSDSYSEERYLAGVEFGEDRIVLNKDCVRKCCEEKLKCVERVRTEASRRRWREMNMWEQTNTRYEG